MSHETPWLSPHVCPENSLPFPGTSCFYMGQYHVVWLLSQSMSEGVIKPGTHNFSAHLITFPHRESMGADYGSYQSLL